MGRRVLGGVLFGVVVYAGILLWSDADTLGAALEDFPLRVLFYACALSFANYVLRFAKWERYRKLLGIELERGTSFCVYLAGFSMGVTPGKMGEVFKSWLVRNINGVPIHRSAPIVVAERVTDLLGYLLLMAIGGLASYPEMQWVFWVTLGVVLVGLTFAGSEGFARWVSAAVARTPYLWRIKDKVRGSFESTRVLLAPREVIGPTLLSTFSWGLECTGFWLIANAMVDGGVPFLFAVFAYAFSAVAGAVAIIFPGGLIVTEGSMGTLLRRQYEGGLLASGTAPDVALQIARSQAVGATLLARLCTLWFGVVVGLIATAWFHRQHGKVEMS